MRGGAPSPPRIRFAREVMEKEDLKLWMTIVDVITEGNMGRSTNSILPTMASILCISDACEHGVGGLIIVNGIGFAW